MRSVLSGHSRALLGPRWHCTEADSGGLGLPGHCGYVDRACLFAAVLGVTAGAVHSTAASESNDAR